MNFFKDAKSRQPESSDKKLNFFILVVNVSMLALYEGVRVHLGSICLESLIGMVILILHRHSSKKDHLYLTLKKVQIIKNVLIFVDN